MPQKREGISRRELLLAGAAGAGIVTVAGGLYALTTEAGAAGKSGADIPYQYKKVDPRRAAELAYDNWYRNFCGYGSASGIIMTQQELVGGRWNEFPIMAVKFGEGGIEGWGTVCGTLMGAGVALSLAAGEDAKPMINDLMDWYSKTQLPVFTPANPRAQFKSRTVSDSPLCHISVGKWMQAEQKGLSSPERKDRCARVTASVAYKAVSMLNDWKDGKYVPAYKGKQTSCGITSQNNCTDCHGDNVPSPI